MISNSKRDTTYVLNNIKAAINAGPDSQYPEIYEAVRRIELSLKITEGLPDWALKDVAEMSLLERWRYPIRQKWDELMRILERVRLEL